MFCYKYNTLVKLLYFGIAFEQLPSPNNKTLKCPLLSVKYSHDLVTWDANACSKTSMDHITYEQILSVGF